MGPIIKGLAECGRVDLNCALISAQSFPKKKPVTEKFQDGNENEVLRN
jgi:hypothetical protein